MFKAGDKVKRAKKHCDQHTEHIVFSGSIVTIDKVFQGGLFSVVEYSGLYDSSFFELVEKKQETVGFETKVLQAIAKGVLSNDQQMLAELVVKRDILQKEIERLNQQIYAKQLDVNRLTNFVA